MALHMGPGRGVDFGNFSLAVSQFYRPGPVPSRLNLHVHFSSYLCLRPASQAGGEGVSQIPRGGRMTHEDPWHVSQHEGSGAHVCTAGSHGGLECHASVLRRSALRGAVAARRERLGGGGAARRRGRLDKFYYILGKGWAQGKYASAAQRGG